MTADRWQLVAETFEAIVDLPAGERNAFLAELGSRDPALAGEVESLLEEDARQGDPGGGGVPDLAGERIGAYRILRLIGEGGMGAVYEAARDDDAFERHVAIKLLPPGLPSRQLIQRFLLERQILARLNHPGVAALLDAGTTANGQPYLVMEYVEGGVPIHVYCRERSLDVTGRIRLFQAVCDAVQYAHQNLVVHRDLKPQNVLVTPDGKVKLLDFGIAKLMRSDAWAAGNDLTMTELAPMTLAYASPEQVRGEPISTASDVYSLGVVLYELLAGSKPYGSGAQTRGELERAVCNTEPRLPSVSVRSVKPNAGQLARRLSGDLDAIVMMALRKESERRYQSAAELREDLERHLDGRPVHARRSTAWYRAGRLIRRYRWTVMAASAVIAALAAGLIATMMQARIARAQRALAERRFGEIRKLANSFLFEFDGAISDLAGATEARRLVVRKALEYLAALNRESHGDSQLQTELATAYERVADIQGNPYIANLGDRAGAVLSYSEALRIWNTIAQRPNGNAAAPHVVILLRSTGDVLSEEQRHEEALAKYREALAVEEKRSPGLSQQRLVLMGRIGTELAMLGRAGEGAQWGQRAVQEAHALLGAGMDEATKHDVSALYGRVGRALLRTGALDAAASMHHEEINMCENLVASVPPEKNSHYRRDLALAYRNLGDVLARQNQNRPALSWYGQARSMEEAMLREDAANSQIRMELGVTFSKIGGVLTRTGDLAGAERMLLRNIPMSERLLKDDPASDAYRRMHAYDLFQMGDLLRKQSRIAEARRYYLREAGVLKPLENDASPSSQRYLMNCYRALGEIEPDRQVAAGYLAQGLTLAEKLGDAASGSAIRRAMAGVR